MIEGKTKSGFEFKIEDAALDDWELLEYLTELDEGDLSHVAKINKSLLGTEQTKALKEHVRDETGRVRTSLMVEELGEILTSMNETKN